MSNQVPLPYTLDGYPVHFRRLIQLASEYDSDFASSGLKFTSEAAAILRANGHAVAENEEKQDG